MNTLNETEGDREQRCSCALIPGVHTMGDHVKPAERCARCNAVLRPWKDYVAFGRVFRKPAKRLCPECLRDVRTVRAK